MKNCKYKPSKYNVLIDDENDALILANTLNGKVKKYHSKTKKQIKGILNEDVIQDMDSYVYELVNEGFLVNSSINERMLADYRFNQVFYNNSGLDLMIVPTDACNMRCRYCYEPHIPHFMDAEHIDILIKYLKKAMRTSSSVNITWFGGEPLLSLDAICRVMEKVQYFGKLYKIPVVSSIVTNGYLLNKETFDKLYRCGVRKFQITIDGFKETHNYYRPLITNEDSYDVIISNLENILIQNNRVNVIIRSNVSEKDIHARIKFIDYIKNKFLCDDRFHLSIINVRDYGGNSVQNLSLSNYNKLEQLMTHCFELGINPLGNDCLDINNLCCEHAPNNSFYINWDLSVYKCSDIVYSKYEEDGRVGRIDSNGNMNIDDYKMACWMRRKLNSQKCNNCVFYPLCYSHHCPYEINYRKYRNCDDFIGNIMYMIRSQAWKLKPIEIVEETKYGE